jgi:HEAT repeat protein
MAITTKSSISVNPDRGRDMAVPPDDGGRREMRRFDITPKVQAGLGRFRWRWACVVAGLVLATGCQKGRTSLRDEGKGVGELRAMLADGDAEVRARGAFGLSRHGAAAGEAIPELTPLLADPHPLVRQNAALALGAVGPAARPAVAALADALKDPEWAVRRQAAVALGAIGPDARAALPAVRKLEADPNKVVRDAAKQAREKIGG